MIPTAILTMGDEGDRAFIRELFLRNERVMYGMAMKLVKEHYTACDMVSASCIQMIEKVRYLREIDPRKQTPYILSIVKNTSLMYLRQRRSEKLYLTADEKTLDWIAHFSEELDDALMFSLHFISSSVSRKISGAIFSRSFLSVRLYSGYAQARIAIPTTPSTIPRGIARFPITSPNSDMAKLIPIPIMSVPTTPTMMETIVAFLPTLASNARSCSILSGSLGAYLSRMACTSSCCFAE